MEAIEKFIRSMIDYLVEKIFDEVEDRQIEVDMELGGTKITIRRKE